jgi:hypothetical protein
MTNSSFSTIAKDFHLATLFLISELIADEDFSMLSKNLFDLAQAFETSLLVFH